MTEPWRLDLVFYLNLWANETTVDALAPGLSPNFSLAESHEKWVEVGDVRFALYSSDSTDVWAECPELFDGDPIASLPTSWPILAETEVAAHEKAAMAIAALMLKAFNHPEVIAAEGYNLEAHMIVGWFVDQTFYVPKYQYTNAPPNNRFLKETVQIYRPALEKALREADVQFEEPVFGTQWVSDETHRFIEPSA